MFTYHCVWLYNNSMDDAAENSDDSKHSGPLRGVVLTTSEGRLLLAGIAGLLLYIVWAGIQLIFSPASFHQILGLTATEVIFGRIACMAFGYSLGLNHTMVILICIILETILVLIFYPLLVFTWRQLLAFKWLRGISNRTRITAENRKDTVQRYGIIGLFVFVWLPFWMTGPVVGCMIGYLLGLRVKVNITTVLIGTYVAILGWAFLLKQLHQKTMSYSSYGIITLAAVISAAALFWTFRKNASRKTRNHDDDPERTTSLLADNRRNTEHRHQQGNGNRTDDQSHQGNHQWLDE